MDLLDIDAPYDELLHVVIRTGHSRFPVFEERRDNVIGILMAKDLLKLQRSPDLNLRTLLRPAVFVPESKAPERAAARLPLQPQPPGDRHRRVRQHRRPAHDRGRARGDRRRDRGRVRRRRTASRSIYTLADGSQRVAGDATIAAVNEAFDVALPTDEFDTIGGLVAQELGRVPRRGESVTVGGLVFSVMLARGGAVRWFKVTRAAEEALGSDGA